MLCVVHVVSEQHQLAGFPVSPNEYVTAARELQPLLVGVVEGYPMVAKNPARAVSQPSIPWVVLIGRGFTAEPNRITPDFAVAVGDTVLLAGFTRPDSDVSPVEYLRTPASVVVGRILGSHAAGCYDVLVPAGEYSGFIGGPVASRAADGTFRVWGIIVGQRPDVPVLPPVGVHLEVARLLPDRP
jgi:hypothetical protein